MTISAEWDPVAWARLARDFTIELFFSCFWAVKLYVSLGMLYLEYELYELSDLVWIRWNCDSWVLTWCEHDVCMGWFVELKWWVWYGFDMRHEWRLVNEYGMVSVWNTLLHSRFVKHEWNGFNMEYKWGWIVKVDMRYIHMHVKYYLFDYDWSMVSA